MLAHPYFSGIPTSGVVTKCMFGQVCKLFCVKGWWKNNPKTVHITLFKKHFTEQHNKVVISKCQFSLNVENITTVRACPIKNMQWGDLTIFTSMVGQLTSTSFEDLEKFQILQTKKNTDFSEFSKEKSTV